jgi:pSer/pThr/pTyr-binding forkhead associated (FHA) protein
MTSSKTASEVPTMIIGRSDPHRNHRPQVDLGPIDIKNTVSRTHAEIYPGTGGRLLIEDKGSLNGTKLNGMRLRPNEPQPLQPMDQCVFGDVAFRFVDGKLKQV